MRERAIIHFNDMNVKISGWTPGGQEGLERPALSARPRWGPGNAMTWNLSPCCCDWLRSGTRSAALGHLILYRSLMVTRGLWRVTFLRFPFICILFVSLNTAAAWPNELQQLAAIHFGTDQ